MKTVMKKMLSLMLVAILLVSAVPTAFAEEAVMCTRDGCDHIGETAVRQPDYDVAPTCTEAGKIGYYCQGGHKVYADGAAELGHDLDDGVITTEATCTTKGTKTYTCQRGCGYTETEKTPAALHTWADATCTAPRTCSVCGTTKEAALGHTWQDATCTAPKTCSVCGATEGAANGHTLGENKVCTTCGYCDYCKVNTNTAEHPVSCPNNADYQTTCSKCGTTYVTANGHPDCEVCDGCHATASCPYCAVCWENGDQVQTHKTAAHCAECDTVNGHASTCSKYKYPETGSHKLKVWARIWVHETKFETRLLDTITGLSGDAKIYQVIAANKSRLEAELPYDEFHLLHWSETISRKNDDNNYVDVGTSLTVGDEDEVFINLYSAEKLLVVNVHTSKSYGYDLSVRLEGFREGDTVTYEDVLKAVKKYYNVSTMSIYTYEEMEKMLAGKDANKTINYIAGDREDPYEVFITGSRKGGTYTYTADSSNPKTGDMIFAPAIVMGASLTCLAVLFYLNKKRAY